MTKMNILRGTAIFVAQLPLILFVGAKYDLVFGFNRMDSGFGALLFLFVLAPLLNLSWFTIEVARVVRLPRRRHRSATILMPLVALFFLMESAAIDLYIASHARM